MTDKIVYGHGDVIVKPISKIPDAAKQKEGKAVLAYGEVTGHSHQISSGVASMLTFDDKTYLRVQSKIACLTHEEHAKVELPAGDYEVIIQREWKPEGWSKVID